MNARKRNPFRLSFLKITIICCLMLGIAYTSIYYINAEGLQRQNNQKKVQILAADFDNQIETFENTTINVAIEKVYQPFYFNKDPMYIYDLLEDFEQYKNYSVLSNGEDNFFLTSGHLCRKDVYIQNLNEDEKTGFWEKLNEVLNSKTETIGELKHVGTSKGVYFMLPFRVRSATGKETAAIGFFVEKEKFQERFEIVSGDIEGVFALYSGEELLYSNQDNILNSKQRNLFSADTVDGQYTVYYIPKTEKGIYSTADAIQAVIILAEIVLIILIAVMYADKTYKPFEDIKEKYGQTIELEKEPQNKNALDEITLMMEELVQSNTRISKQIDQNHRMLRGQVLRSLIDGTVTDKTQQYLDDLQMKLPGPYYYVLSIAFSDEEHISDDFLTIVKTQVESLTIESKRYIYSICDSAKRAVYAICSVSNQESVSQLNKEAEEVVMQYFFHPIIGAGNAQRDLNRLSASWLESMDQIHKKKQKKTGTVAPGFAYDPNSMNRIFEALDREDKEAAMASLEEYVMQIKEGCLSLLMQKYMISDFTSEMNRQARKYGIELSKRIISQLLSASDIELFESVAKELIIELYEKIKLSKAASEENESFRVFQYVNTHYAEYDMSLEKTAEELNVSDKFVRAAIQKHTGKMYKDYIIFLRIEFAKTLLENEKLSVNEICQMVGYSNVPYFIKLFKKTTGVTPAKYKLGMKQFDELELIDGDIDEIID